MSARPRHPAGSTGVAHLRNTLGRLVLVTTSFVAVACATEPPTDPVADVRTVGAEAQPARQPVPPPSGMLSTCKQGGAGIPAGQSFTFTVTLAGVMRTVIVGAGNCLQLGVPRESNPLGKGYFHNTPAAVANLLPGTTTLRVDGADISSAQAQAILSAAPDVTASSSLLFNLTQQLIAADLNLLRGVQPTTSVLQAMTEANAVLAITVGAQILLTTALDPAALSPLVNTLSDFNEGKMKLSAAPLSVGADVVELVGSLVELTGISCAPADRCSGADLGSARVAATVASGATTTVTFTNRSRPVLRACKVAGPGIAAGRVFRLSAGGINVTDAALLDVPAGECRDAVLTAGNYMVAESGALTGIAVSSITCAPASNCTDASLGVAVVTVAVPRGITTVTFTNRSSLGVLRFCKVAGSGITTGRVFGMVAGGINLVGKPGEATSVSLDVPAGECREATLLEGLYQATEPNPPLGVAVSDMTCVPAERCSNVSIGVGSLHAQVVGAMTTTVTITNRATYGTLRLCKVAGTGIAAGRTFTMVAGGINLTGRTGEPTSGQADVPAGQCRDVTLLEGLYSVTENGPTTVGTAVSAIACEPSARCSDVSLGVRAVKAQIIGASATTVTFTNRSTLGTLRLCKLAGPGVTPGTMFQLYAGGINLSGTAPEPTSATIAVPAGECRSASVLEGLYDVTEPTPGVGIAVSAISCVPTERCPDVNVSVGNVKAIMVGGSTTEVTFTNSASAGANVQKRTTSPERTPIRRP